MPIFEYTCRDCGEEFEELVSAAQTESVACPHCHSANAEKLFSAFGIGGAVKFSSSMGSSGCASCKSHNCSGCSAVSS
ncbi:zinc ribbon domain-containing protein [bacterium]|nr:zinc ribbon domain-containing protein [bacterium]